MSLLSTRYVAEGLFLIPTMSMSGFKQYEIALNNKARMQEFIELTGSQGSQSAELLSDLVVTPGGLEAAVRPAFGLTGREARSYDIKVEDAAVIGFNLQVQRSEPTAESPINTLAEYVRHTMIQVDLKDFMLQKCLSNRTAEQQIRNQQIDSDLRVSEAMQRAENLRKLMREIPGASQIDSRQVISLEGGGERFLSPTTQLIAVELEIAEAKLADARRKRDLLSAELRTSYYCRAMDLQSESLTGQQFLGRLKRLQDDVSSSTNSQSEVVEKVSNELALERTSLVDNYLERARFVVSPDGGEQKVRRPGIAVGAVVGTIIGGILGFMLAMALAWWHDNREIVVSADDD